MTEAFAIGVSLALGGGVAAEMSIVRKELIRLGEALTSNGVSVQQLRRSARSSNDRSRVAPTLITKSGNQKSGAPLLEKLQSLQAAQVNGATTIGNSGRQGPAMDRGDISTKPPMPHTTNKKVEPPQHSSLRAMLPFNPENSPVGRLGKLRMSDVAESSTRAVSQARLIAASASRESPGLTPETIPIVAPLARLPTAQNSLSASIPHATIYGAAPSPEPELSFSYPFSLFRQPDNRTEQYRAAVTANFGRSPSPSAPQVPWRGDSHVSETAFQGVARPSPRESVDSYSPSGPFVPGRTMEPDRLNATNGNRMQGDVFLDGALVGRWISRLLSGEAERASVGPTGFDTRRGRLMPGATIGG